MKALAPELRFVCACCGWPDDAERRARIAQAAGAVRDWGEVERLAREHRVEGLVAHGAAAAGLGDRFGAVAERVKLRALEDLAETVRVARALDRAGVRHAILKGLPLGLRAFGSPVLKQSWDIDVLTAPADAVAAGQALLGLGYAPHMPARAFTDAEFRHWSTVSKEAEFRSPSGRTVELHWRVSDHPMLLGGVSVEAADRPVELLDGAAVMTLGDAPNLAYLAVHGAWHGWSRLKWLADFSGFLAARPETERGPLLHAARAHGAGHALDQALVLSRDLLGVELGPRVAAADAERLAEPALAVIDRRGRTSDFDTDPEASRAILRNQRLLMPGARFKLIAAYHRLRGSEDRRIIALPKGFHWAYWIIRPFSAIFRTLLRRVHRSRNGVCP